MALGFLALPSRAEKPYSVARVPDWVERIAVPAGEGARAPSRRADFEQLLVDEQDRHVPSTGSERYRHYAFRLLTAAGVHNNSELEIEFDPGFQKLAMHYVRILRGAEALDALATSQVRVTSSQSDEEARIYDDELSVNVLLNDTRVGDTIEYAYTRKGNNPALHGHIASSFSLARSIPIDLSYQRLSYGGPTTLRTHTERSSLSAEKRQSGGFQELVWRQENLSGVESEDSLPEWFDAVPWVQVSDFATWSDVVAWALPLYDKPSTLTREAESALRGWMTESPERRLVSALRFVQDEVRYLGIEVGPNSLEPRPAARVLEQRFGDCKDKSLLLVTLLRRLGLHAAPALVSSSGSPLVKEMVPSPFAFDHVIVKATIGDRSFFIDPTVTHQRGDAERLRAPDRGSALVIEKGVDRLEEMPDGRSAAPLVDISETYEIGEDNKTATLTVHTEYRGERAVQTRRQFSTESEAHAQREYENFYAQHFPSVKVDKPLGYTDQEATNTVQIVETYDLTPFFQNDIQTVNAWAIRDHLEKPEFVKRTLPLALPFPLHVQQRIIVDWPSMNPGDLSPVMLEGPGIRFRRKVARVGQQVIFDYEVETSTDYVEAADSARYLETVDKIIDETSYKLTLTKDAPTTSTPGWVLPSAVLGVAGSVGVGLLVSTRRRRRFRARQVVRGGETAASAFHVNTAAEALAATAAAKCACGARLALSDVRASAGVQFGGKLLTVVEANCSRCGDRTVRYFAVEESQPKSAEGAPA